MNRSLRFVDQVYSSQRLHLAPGLETHLVNTSQA